MVCCDLQDQPPLPVYPAVHQIRKSLSVQTLGSAILFQTLFYGREDSQRIAELVSLPTKCSGAIMLFQTQFYDKEINFFYVISMCFHNVWLLPSHLYPEAHDKRQCTLHTAKMPLLRASFPMCFHSTLWLPDGHFGHSHTHISLDLPLTVCMLPLAPLESPQRGPWHNHSYMKGRDGSFELE